MAHIHTDPGQYDHTISIYLFRTDFDEPKVMLHMHRKIGLYTQFGGHIELDENPWQTVTHELKEETGYNIDQTQILQPDHGMTTITGATLHPYPVAHVTVGYPTTLKHFHTDSNYAFITDQDPLDQPAEGEATDLQLFTRAELVSLGSNKIDNYTREIALHIFDEILMAWRPVSPAKFT